MVVLGIDVEVCKLCESEFVKKATALDSSNLRTYFTCSLFRGCQYYTSKEVKWGKYVPHSNCPIPSKCPSKAVHVLRDKKVTTECINTHSSSEGIKSECPYLEVKIKQINPKLKNKRNNGKK